VRKTARILLIVLVNLLLLEGLLRLQQVLGPVYDLEMASVTRETFSDDLNHVPLPLETWTLRRREVFGGHAGHTYVIPRDSLGVRTDACPPPGDPAASVEILFLGDSFVEGYDHAHTLPHLAREALGDRLGTDPPVRMLNAGHSSYSPAILAPQARRLMPVLSPDLVVVVVDQTDLGDDFIRYEPLVRLDEAGRIAGVGASPVGVAFVDGLLEARRSPVYLWRLLRKLVHTHVRMPIFRRGYRSWYPRQPLYFARNPGGSVETYRREIGVFSRNLDDLLTTLVASVGDPGRVLLVCHPHFRQLVPGDDGILWQDFVTPAVAAAAERAGTRFLDARPGLVEAFDGRPEDFYWPGDMHFNFDGMRRYGALIGAALAPMVADRLAAGDQSKEISSGSSLTSSSR